MLEDRRWPAWVENRSNGLKTGSGKVAPVLNTSRDGTRDTLPFLRPEEASSPPAEPAVELPA